jgi:branched-chain amino acid transport system ATP-binding protein
MGEMLKVNAINVFYHQFHALWDITFEVSKGEVVTLLGPNGAGKTTSLKTISGILRPRSGTIEFEGTRVDELPAHVVVERGIAHIPQGRGVFPLLTVLENLTMGAYNKRAREHYADVLENVFSMFPILKERRRQTASTLSGGEQQMLAIGRALMSSPTLLMLDEPSEGLAPKVVAQVFEIVAKLHDEGVTVLLVEQNVHEALEIADRAYVAEAGKIVLSGSSDEVLQDDHVKKAYLGI